MNYKKWTKEEVIQLRLMIKNNNSVEEIMVQFNRTFDSIKKKLFRLTNQKISKTKKISKHNRHDWMRIQKHYDTGVSTLDLRKKFKITPQAIKWAQNNGKLKTRNLSQASKIRYAHIKTNPEYFSYRNQCRFRFNVYDYPQEFDLKLLKKYGLYSPTNRKNNLNGISRDHIYSVYDGYVNKIDPQILSHPANCRLIKQNENSKKHKKSEITLIALKKKIYIWDKKYKAGWSR
jgi:hypothetical protein